jgi:hypothetical protein
MASKILGWAGFRDAVIGLQALTSVSSIAACSEVNRPGSDAGTLNDAGAANDGWTIDDTTVAEDATRDPDAEVGSGEAGMSDDGSSADDGISGDPGCTYPTPPSPTCYVESPAPAATPVVECRRGVTELDAPVADVLRMHGDDVYALLDRNIVRLHGSSFDVVAGSGDVEWYDFDGDALIFMTRYDAALPAIHRQNLDGTGRATIATGVQTRFVVDDGRVYFDSGGRLVRTLAAGGGPIEPMDGPGVLQSLWDGQGAPLIDSTHIYYYVGNPPGVSLYRTTKSTGIHELIAEHLPSAPRRLIGDQVLLAGDDGDIFVLPKSGGDCPRFLVHGSKNLIADDKAIYWWTTGTNTQPQPLKLYRTTLRGGVNVEVGGEGPVRDIYWAMLTPSRLVFGAGLVDYRARLWELLR